MALRAVDLIGGLLLVPALASASGDAITKRSAAVLDVVGPGTVANVKGASVDVVDKVLSAADVRNAIDRCWAQRTVEKATTLKVSLRVASSGVIKQLAVRTQGKRGKRIAKLGRCVKRGLRLGRFAKHPQQRHISFDLQLVVGQPTSQPIIGGGTLRKEVIRQVIRSRIPAVQACYERYLLKGGTKQGRLVVQFTIAATGKVVAVKTAGSDFKDQSLGQCVMTAILKWVFPKPKGGGIVIVSYPFIFRTMP